MKDDMKKIGDGMYAGISAVMLTDLFNNIGTESRLHIKGVRLPNEFGGLDENTELEFYRTPASMRLETFHIGPGIERFNILCCDVFGCQRKRIGLARMSAYPKAVGLLLKAVYNGKMKQLKFDIVTSHTDTDSIPRYVQDCFRRILGKYSLMECYSED